MGAVREEILPVARSVSARPWRTLVTLAGLVAALYGLVGAGTIWSNAQWQPKLALDLAGGTQFVLDAVPRPGTTGSITPDTMNEALKIERARVNGNGVSEADVALQGTKSLVITLPGATVDPELKKALTSAAAMEFRPVLAQVDPTPVATPSASASGSADATSKATGAAVSGEAVSSAAASSPAAATTKATSTPSVSTSSNGMPLPRALLAATTTPTASPAAGATSAPAAAGSTPSAAASAQPSPLASPTDASDPNYLTDALAATFQSVDCTTEAGRKAAQKMPNVAAAAYIACEANGSKYALGPVEVEGSNISGATASLETTAQGQTTTSWQVNLTFDSKGADTFAKVTARLLPLPAPRNQFAIVLDNQVISAPRTLGVINGGEAQITGNFTQDSATALANQLKFGALPLSFQVTNESAISATLGSEQLQRGLLAGLIGLLLVVVYSLAQYRALGLVTVGSLLVAAVITYGLVLLMGWRQGLRLSLPGVAGLIVSIGITADSFIVYFERVRDEVRDGRSLAAAVELAWARARRTILISDFVSLLAAVVLYMLAVGGVRGFAFTLGLTTLVDVFVVFMFTKPVVSLLARTHFFGGGHKLSGFDAEHLGRSVAYAGRGRVKAPVGAGAVAGSGEANSKAAVASSGATIAERRAAAARALEDEPSAATSDTSPRTGKDL